MIDLFPVLQIENELIYWPRPMIHKCKLRLTKIRQSLIRSRMLELSEGPTLVPVKKKVERRMKVREMKAERAAKISKVIESELLERLKGGVYGKDTVEGAKDCSKVLEELAEQDYTTLHRDLESDHEEFVPAESDLEEDQIQDIEDLSFSSTISDSESVISNEGSGDSFGSEMRPVSSKPKRVSKRRRRNTELEYENADIPLEHIGK